MHGVFLDLESVNPRDLDLGGLRDCLPDWNFYSHTSTRQIVERIRDAQVIVTNKAALTRADLGAARDLRLICVAATGTNNIDLSAAAEAGVTVSNARNYATASVVEHVFSLILTLIRHLDSYRSGVKAGDWSRSRHFCLFDGTIEELSGKTLGIIGYGVLGQAVAHLACALSMQVTIAQRLHGTPLPGRTRLEQLLETADIISLHCPLSAETRNLIGERQLRRMKNSAILINTARGGIVDEAALVTALQQGWIAGAGVDVLTQEPPVVSNPLLEYSSPQLVVTPHIAWASRSARQRLIVEITENIKSFVRGKPRNTVD